MAMEEVGNCDNGGGCDAGGESCENLPENAFIVEVKWGRRRSTVAMRAATSSNSLVDYKNTKERYIRDTIIHAKEPTAIAFSRQMQTLPSTRTKSMLANVGLLAQVAKLLTSWKKVVWVALWRKALLYCDLYAPKGLNSARIFFTCHNFEYQETAHPSELESCGLKVPRLNISDRMQDHSTHDHINPVKGALVCSIIITTVSPAYAQEVAGGIWVADTVGLEFVLILGVACWSILTASTHVSAKFGLQVLPAESLPLVQFQYFFMIHCHDWRTAFIAPLYWDLYASKGFNSARNFFTCLNFEYQETAHPSELESCGLKVPSLNIPDRVQDHSAHDHIYPVKGALVYSNIVTTVSPTYAQEVRTSQVDCITILVLQKGLHLTRHAIYRMLELGGQLALLGSSPVPHIQGVFEELVNHFKDHPDVWLILKYDEVLSNSINAASDMFIMRLIFEPYGLTQMIAMEFVFVPIARKTGDLNDSVLDVDDDTVLLQLLYGFIFLSSNEQGVNCALDPAFNLYMEHNESWQQLVK